MAILSSDGTYVTVVKGDTLWGIASKYLGSGTKYKQLAAINNIPNPNLIYVGQTIRLSASSGGGGSSTSTASSTNSKATITQFGLQSDTDSTLFATWSWAASHTDSYNVMWLYDTGDSVWFVGNDTNISVNDNAPSASRQSTYSIPSNAKRVKFKVKPISEKYKNNDNEVSYWTASWSTEKIYNTSDSPPKTPSVPSVEVEDFKLTATLSNLDLNATSIQFKIVQDDTTVYKISNTTIKTATNSAVYSCTISDGHKYKVCCRSVRGNLYSDWSNYTDSVITVPSAPSTITTCQARSKTSVYLEWPAISTADTYDVEYATKLEYFDGSNQTSTVTGIEFNHYELGGLEAGSEYFFRVRAVNEKGHSAWSGIKSVAIGKVPSAPTTWSSTTTAITGEPLTLFWTHNSEDGSTQTYAEIELYINDVKETHTVNSTTEDDEHKTSYYEIDTSKFSVGTKILWRVRTAGVTKEFSEWSVQRMVDVYAPPTLVLKSIDSNGNPLDLIESFPFYISGLPGPTTQVPIGYYLVVTSNESYETVDDIGNAKVVNVGDELYSKYFDISTSLMVELSASNINLENNVKYTVTCTVTMNSGLSVEDSCEFTVSWTDMEYEPNAEISIDTDSYTASVKPYCQEHTLTYYQVTNASGVYTKTATALAGVYGEVVSGAVTTTGELVYSGVTVDGTEVYYCEVDVSTLVDGITLSVYRREFDGSFTELATGLPNVANTFITDPHPALDYARYRVIATVTSTGAISYYDVPAYPVGGKAVIIQWDEAWSNFDTTNEDALEQPPWSGSLLKLPYNIDVSDSHSNDVSLIEYIGRKHPVSYYGTQLGETSTWNIDIAKSDKETLYSLRRLAIWMGDVYVREPSGSGYWANISVSFSQKHCELTIPVSLTITRVTGGV